jgi:hypothetical protein
MSDFDMPVCGSVSAWFIYVFFFDGVSSLRVVHSLADKIFRETVDGLRQDIDIFTTFVLEIE